MALPNFGRSFLGNVVPVTDTVETRVLAHLIWLLFRVRALELSHPIDGAAARELARDVDAQVGGKLLRGETLTLTEMRDLIEVLL
jgi:hypothetical protein